MGALASEVSRPHRAYSRCAWSLARRHDTAEAAARAYDEAAREIYGPDARLNFPGPGECGVVASRLVQGLCTNGHDLSEHGYRRT